jgi:hypothetical protein
VNHLQLPIEQECIIDGWKIECAHQVLVGPGPTYPSVPDQRIETSGGKPYWPDGEKVFSRTTGADRVIETHAFTYTKTVEPPRLPPLALGLYELGPINSVFMKDNAPMLFGPAGIGMFSWMGIFEKPEGE